ncbi:HotDog domain-containing protein [Mycena rebaudengoi]|nr:HotDog domain-containing protein [Mycena rebaudengoi]
MPPILLVGRIAGYRAALRSARPPSPNLLRLRTTAASATDSQSRSFSAFTTASFVTAVSLGAYVLGAVYPPTTISLLYPRPAPPPPSDVNSQESLAYTAALEEELLSLPLLKTHRERRDADEWYETRPGVNIPPEVAGNKLTAGALRGPGKLALLPLARVKKDESEAIIIVHLGRGLCGHDGIVHGGLLATLLDEALGRNAISNLPDKVGVTASLSLKYRAPTRADQFVVVKTQAEQVNGRKVTAVGRVEDLKGTLLVEAHALFVQPRYAKLLNSSLVRQHMGEPPKEPILLADGGKLPK